MLMTGFFLSGLTSKTTEIYTHISTKGFNQIKSPLDLLDKKKSVHLVVINQQQYYHGKNSFPIPRLRGPVPRLRGFVPRLRDERLALVDKHRF